MQTQTSTTQTSTKTPSAAQQQHVTGSAAAAWWKHAVIYQIYPRSYADSNADGIGDLPGIIAKLPYIASLGVDAIWISPFFTSPMKDFGYDVSDYKAVDPMFGTLADFKTLIAAAHARNLKVLIDQVYSHTSDQHPWFKTSQQNRDNPKADWYVWADALPDGSPPNNWQSIFGGSAWHWHAKRGQYYLHNFLVEQPDLNFHQPAVVEAILAVAKFWLDCGVDGFRLDTVNFYFHDQKLRSNPPLAQRPTGMSNLTFNPYHFQEHLYDKTRPENLGFLKKLRALLDNYGEVMTIGEVGEEARGLEIINAYTHSDDKLHTCYSFDFLNDNFSPAYFKQTLERLAALQANETAAQSYACWSFSNHDVTRSYTRWLPQTDAQEQQQWNGDFAKLLLALLGSLAGPICIYQGEELGLPEAELAYEELRDPYGIYFYPEYKGRDGCRTPMPWRTAAAHAGFSTAKRPWLPVNISHRALAVDVQEQQADSPLAFTRAFLAFRKTNMPLTRGKLKVLLANEVCLLLERSLGTERIHGYFNFTAEKLQLALVAACKVEPLFVAGFMGIVSDADGGQTLSLTGYGCCFLSVDATI